MSGENTMDNVFDIVFGRRELIRIFGSNAERWIKYFMDIAERTSQMSYANKRKVGVVAVDRNRGIIDVAFNGMPPSWPNACEDDDGDTYDEVEHAERNLVSRCARSGKALGDSVVFSTDAPCIECARALHIAGVKILIFKNDYKDERGLEYLKTADVLVIKR